MLTEIQLTNFKAFGFHVQLPLAPITLLFGGNSAGKSSVFHALHLAREVLSRGNFDPDRTEMGGGTLDLGGFANLVYRHELERPVRLGFTLRDLSWPEAPAFDNDHRDAAGDEAPVDDEVDEGEIPFACRRNEDGSADDSTRVVIELRWSHALGRAQIVAFEIARGDRCEPGLRIESTLDGRDVRITQVDGWHLRVSPEHPEYEAHPDLQTAIDLLQRTPREPDAPWSIAVYGFDQGLLPRGRALHLWDPYAPAGDDPRRDDPRVRAFARQASRWIHGALDGLREELSKMLHLGPVRSLPARAYEPPRSPAPWRWHAGLGAWDMLHLADATFVESVNEWLSGEEGLGTQCLLQQRDVVEIDSDVWDRIKSLAVEGSDPASLQSLIGQQSARRRLKLYDEVHGVEVAPRDLGVGISQVLPVVVAALQTRYGLVCLEQPELHVHPRVAVALGDLFAENRRGKQFLIETHSEHLLLRLMRRVRETGMDFRAADDARALTAEDISVLYFGVGRDGGTVVSRLRLERHGSFQDIWPEGFFEERFAEVMGS